MFSCAYAFMSRKFVLVLLMFTLFHVPMLLMSWHSYCYAYASVKTVVVFLLNDFYYCFFKFWLKLISLQNPLTCFLYVDVLTYQTYQSLGLFFVPKQICSFFVEYSYQGHTMTRMIWFEISRFPVQIQECGQWKPNVN